MLANVSDIEGQEESQWVCVGGRQGGACSERIALQMVVGWGSGLGVVMLHPVSSNC